MHSLQFFSDNEKDNKPNLPLRKIKIFQKQKKYSVKKSNNAEKPKKRPFRLIKRFLPTENFKTIKGVPFERIQKLSEKSLIVPKKTKGDPLVSPLNLETLKHLWFSARLEPTLFCL